MDLRYSFAKYRELAPSLRRQIDDAARNEFGDSPLVRQYQWAVPHFTFFALEGDALAASVNLVAREVLWDGAKVPAAGVNNLVVQKSYRGQRHGTEVLQRAMEFAFTKLGARVGLLFCADELVAFYEKLGWRQTKATVHFPQPSGQCQWPSNRLWLTSTAPVPEPTQIDLRGFPW